MSINIQVYPFHIYFFLTAMLMTLTEQLRQNFKHILLNISEDMTRKDIQKIYSLCTERISISDTKILVIFRRLEHERLISWKDVDYLKYLMREIRRLDIAETLTEYENKRDLTILLDFYARKRQGLDFTCCSHNVRRVAGYLTRLMDMVEDNIDIVNIITSVNSSKEIRNALVNFEEEIDCREQTFSWNEFMMLVVIAGELLAIASASEVRSESVMELCSTAADELCPRMIELGSWVS